jgi:hypothetical protein
MSSSEQDHTDQLSWQLLVLTREKIASLWEKFQEFPQAFDDLTLGDYNRFMRVLMDPANVFYEIGDELGLASAMQVRPRLDAVIHLTMFDRRLRGREQTFLEILDDLFTRAKLARVTAAVHEDRATARKLVERIGFTYEGTLTRAALRDGNYVNIDIYSLLKEELYGGEVRWDLRQHLLSRVLQLPWEELGLRSPEPLRQEEEAAST